ncbi:Heavy metal-associated domain containing protein [Parasponia andersonii]|uniref:Heavy metal-associated domain containing protein n=1 Tax=Parasponia andersonii TaxID=3476 RepID=A0A2P5DMF0_PARAD|nr:Heavy metal-associated domain containing protein [Parasponia andersonii]
MKKTVLKVSINCEKCKKEVLKAVTKLSGINQVAVDAEKETVTVVGDVDPVMIVKQIKKTGKCADIISVGPPEPVEPKIECVVLPPCCNDCQLIAVGYAPHVRGGCNIL